MTDILHPERGGYSGQSPKLGVVVHTSEGREGGTASAGLISFLSSPGDRPNGNGGFYGSGYHAVALEDGGYEQIASANRNPYHAPPLNATWWSICIPGKAGQSRDEWLDTASRPYIKGVARFIVDKWRGDHKTWPLTLRTAAELLTGAKGITSHDAVSDAWHRTDHWDPGPNFPWDVLLQDIAALLPPTTLPDEDDMAFNLRITDDGTNVTDVAVFTVSGVFAVWQNNGDAEAALEDAHLVSGDKLVRRVGLKGLTLVGPAPDDPGYESAYNGATLPGRTKGSDFGARLRG